MSVVRWHLFWLLFTEAVFILPLEFCNIQTLKTCFMLYNLYNPDTENGRKRIHERAYRFYSHLPNKGSTNRDPSKAILIIIVSITLAIIYSYARLNFG